MAKTRHPSPKADSVSPEEVPEVQLFEEAKRQLEAAKKKHERALAELAPLIDAYNDALENADKTLRARMVSCGEFDLYTIEVRYDAERLHDELGEEDFLNVGGSIHKETVYEVNEALFEAMVQRGDIPEEVVKAVRTKIPKYHAPKKLKLP